MITDKEKLRKNRILSEHIRSKFPASRHSIVMRRPVFGFGINDADYVTMPKIGNNLVRCPAYRSWHNMIRRTCDKNFQAINESYRDANVCDEWISFMAYRGWWLKNQVDNWDLDKDILRADSKIYSPSTCVFVPRWLNGIIGDCRKRRGSWPIGVSWHKRDQIFQAHCKNPFTGKAEGLGYFRCPKLAHEAWKKHKLSFVKAAKKEMDAIDHRIYDNVVSIIKRSQ